MVISKNILSIINKIKYLSLKILGLLCSTSNSMVQRDDGEIICVTLVLLEATHFKK